MLRRRPFLLSGFFVSLGRWCRYPAPGQKGQLMKFVSVSLAFALAVAPAWVGAQDAGQPAATEEKTEKITDKTHPDYVHCRTEPVIGSRAKKRRVCLTNREWAEVERSGKATATRIVEEGRAGMLGDF